MFSKSVEPLLGIVRRHLRPLSITLRLTLLYMLAAMVILALSSGVLYWLLSHRLIAEDSQFLVDKVNLLRTIMRERPGTPHAFEEEMNWEATTYAHAKYYARVLREDGQIDAETAQMSDVLPRALFPPPSSLAELPREAATWHSPKGKSYLVMAAAGTPHAMVQVALDVTYEHHLLSEYLRALWIAVIVGTIFSGAAAMLVARRGMRPLRDIADVAHRISATQLQQRVGSTQWPTELNELASAFDQMLYRLEDSFERLSHFSANLAHELRTPISNLRGEAEVGLSKARTADEYRQIIESSLEEYSRLSDMIEGLLFLARAEHGQTQVRRSTFEAVEQVEAVREYFDALAEERNIQVTCRGNALISADLQLFRRALSNLLSNALRHTPAGGRVDIVIDETEQKSIRVAVVDNGVGIDEEHLPRVLDPFYKADAPRSGQSGGTGLGLSIVRSIMDLHSGRVCIESEPGKGTTVTLTFPCPSPD